MNEALETPARSSGPGDERVLAVVIPAYNEAATIATTLHRVERLRCVREIIVVDDGSRDRTAAIVEAFASPRVRLIRQENRGKTAAVKRAAQEVTSPITIIQDADLEYDPGEIPEVIAPILEGHADVVYGSRFLVRRAARVLYFYHYLGNKFLTFLSNLLTNRNMTDIETCYKAFRTPLLQRMPISSRGFGMEVEITALICNTRARTYEVPISYYGRTYEEGKKIGLRDGLHALGYILLYNLVARWFPRNRAYVRAVNEWLASEQAATLAASTPAQRQTVPLKLLAGLILGLMCSAAQASLLEYTVDSPKTGAKPALFVPRGQIEQLGDGAQAHPGKALARNALCWSVAGHARCQASPHAVLAAHEGRRYSDGENGRVVFGAAFESGDPVACGSRNAAGGRRTQTLTYPNSMARQRPEAATREPPT